MGVWHIGDIRYILYTLCTIQSCLKLIGVEVSKVCQIRKIRVLVYHTQNLIKYVSPALTDEAAKERASEMEKNKGNEAFKAGDFEESINYYTNSIDIFPSTATYNNRGLASK